MAQKRTSAQSDFRRDWQYTLVAICAILLSCGCQRNQVSSSNHAGSPAAFKGLKHYEEYVRQVRSEAGDPDPFEKDDPRLVRAIRKIRDMLHLSDIEISYQNTNVMSEDRIADCVYDETPTIRLYDNFYARSWASQIDTLIHEHVHVVLMTMDQNYSQLLRETGLAVREDHARSEVLEATVAQLSVAFFDECRDEMKEICQSAPRQRRSTATVRIYESYTTSLP